MISVIRIIWIFSAKKLTKVFCPTYKDALSLLIEFAAIRRAHGDIGILPGPFKASYKFLKVIGISKALVLFSFIYPPLIFHSLHDIPSRTFYMICIQID